MQKIILGGKKPFTGRPGARAAKIDLESTRAELTRKLGCNAADDDLYSHLMYPRVFADFVKFRKAHDDVGVLPTPAFFYGLKPKEEISVHIEEGKTLFIRLLDLTGSDALGQCTAIFELNGYPRHVQVADKSKAKEVVARAKADPADPLQIGAPMPGMVATVAVSVGHSVKPGDTLLTIEAMKMFTTVTAPCEGTVAEVAVKIGTTVESKDLMIKLAK